jgi:hypothetical protein
MQLIDILNAWLSKYDSAPNETSTLNASLDPYEFIGANADIYEMIVLAVEKVYLF